jgi:hypothetical protein
VRDIVPKPLQFPTELPPQDWGDEPELQNMPMPISLGAEQLRRVLGVKDELNHMVQGLGLPPTVHDEKLLKVDYSDLEVRVFALVIKGAADKVREWAEDCRGMSEELMNRAPADTGMDQGHAETLSSIASFLDRLADDVEKS